MLARSLLPTLVVGAGTEAKTPLDVPGCTLMGLETRIEFPMDNLSWR